MPDTGAPWNIPYVDPTDLVIDYPVANEAMADAVAAGLDATKLGTNITSGNIDIGASTFTGGGVFTQRVLLTASNASYTIPVAARKPGVRVTVIGGGGGGSGSASDLAKGTEGGTGGTSTFSVTGVGSVSAGGGSGGVVAVIDSATGKTGTAGFSAGNAGGGGGYGFGRDTNSAGVGGCGGSITVNFMDLTGRTTASVTVGGGGSGGAGSHGPGGPGGRGEIILEH